MVLSFFKSLLCAISFFIYLLLSLVGAIDPHEVRILPNSGKDVVIAIMGATGTGKSTFINLVSGADLPVGDDLMSCTKNVTYSPPFELNGRRVILMDTPGFDDSVMSETDILKMIGHHLATTYEQGFLLSGIIYMHRISDLKMGGVSRTNFNMFRELCGPDALRNVVIVTNMWEMVKPGVGEAREAQLRSNDQLFKPVLDKGAQMIRHDNTLESARSIVGRLVFNYPLPMQLQREIVDEGKDIRLTSAGLELDRRLAEMEKMFEEKLAAILKANEEAMATKDKQTQEELAEARRELEAGMLRIQNERERLSREYAEEQKRTNEQMAKLMENLEEERRVNEEKRQRMEAEFETSRLQDAEKQRELQDQIDRLKSDSGSSGEDGFFKFLGMMTDFIGRAMEANARRRYGPLVGEL